MALSCADDIFEDIENGDITNFLRECHEAKLSTAAIENEKKLLEEELTWITRQLKLAREREDVIKKELISVRKTVEETSIQTTYWAKLQEERDNVTQDADLLRTKVAELYKELQRVTTELELHHENAQTEKKKIQEDLEKFYIAKLDHQKTLNEHNIQEKLQRTAQLEQDNLKLQDAVKHKADILRIEYEEKIAQLKAQVEEARKGETHQLTQTVEFLKKRIQTKEKSFLLEKQQLLARIGDLEKQVDAKQQHKLDETSQTAQSEKASRAVILTPSERSSSSADSNVNVPEPRRATPVAPAKPVNRKRKLFPAYVPGNSFF